MLDIYISIYMDSISWRLQSPKGGSTFWIRPGAWDQELTPPTVRRWDVQMAKVGPFWGPEILSQGIGPFTGDIGRYKG